MSNKTEIRYLSPVDIEKENKVNTVVLKKWVASNILIIKILSF